MIDPVKLTLGDWLDDLCVRFIINLPKEELESTERICFQIEESQWFYEDFIRPLNPQLPALNLRKFCEVMFQHCPLLRAHSNLSAASYQDWLAYKQMVPVRGAIMLNDDMTEVVLVKGWKKAAKWSFPRGKINQGEADLDCAVREVYEETGFDIQAAGLVPPADEVKSLDQTLREQHMKLFVFRGIPRDTYFEPRTRKEISAIDWYKIADLPTTSKRRDQQQGINGEDALKGSHFYMVSPFIRPLRVWINQQRRLDKRHGRHVSKAQLIVEEEEAEDTPAVDETADEALLETTDVEDTGHLERLLFNLRNSRNDAAEAADLPEVSTDIPPVVDLSAQLKGMLGVGGFNTGAQQQQPPPQEQESNPLLAILRGNGPPQPPFASHPQQPNHGVIPPQTPAQQIDLGPPNAHTPHHHNHERQPQTGNMVPPAPFPVGYHFQGQQFQPHPHGPRPFPNQTFPPQHAFHANGPPPPQQQQRIQPPYNGPMPLRMPVHQHIPPPQDRVSQFAPQFPQYNQAPHVPAASKLPPPKLTSHTSSLLNMFKSPAPQAVAPASAQRQMPPPPIPSQDYEQKMPVPAQVSSLQQPPRHPTQSPGVLRPHATKPRNLQQDTLLNLFRAPSAPATPPGVRPPGMEKSSPAIEPVELSAQSPNLSRDKAHPQQQPKLSMRHLPALDTAPPIMGSRSPGSLTSATVSGPLNAPDFDSVHRVQRQQKPAELGNGHPSPLSQHPPQLHTAQQNHLLDILNGAPQILSNSRQSQQNQRQHQQPTVPPPQVRSPPRVPIHTATSKAPMEAPQPFHPTSILRRGNVEIDDMMADSSRSFQPQPPPHSQNQVPIPAPPSQGPLAPQAIQAVFNRRDNAGNQQKQTLLNLFGGSGSSGGGSGNAIKSSFTASPTTTTKEQQHPHSLPLSALPGFPPTMTNSPVSPLPSTASIYAATSKFANRDDSLPISLLTRGSGTGHPSRVGSFGSEAGTGKEAVQGKKKQSVVGKTGGGGGSSVTSPVDNGFLMGLLESVASEGGAGKGAGKGKGKGQLR
ncbi:hypothetical protein EJ08DRAFT_491517 [Tothia fuscella]|uniref:Nudix hydrolase domain-containing protein n=1 Tax=Tothia fuscella TaxID=1048955 RepID=A0A9P4TU08_9PEZI|nr:hypothetical protein EJ08DRAFT_491517 [Tothia fuscella]